MEKWKKSQFEDFLLDERTNCYWFFFKGKIRRKRNKDKLINEIVLPPTEWSGIRFKNGFYNTLDILIQKYMEIYNGQTKKEFQKNYSRVRDIVEKSNGDVDKAIGLAKTQANRITDEMKALNRAFAAKELNQEHIFEVFFQRAYELGSVSKQDYREYKLQKLGI